MSMAGVNYQATFIAIADDCPVAVGTEPPLRSKPTAARVQYEMLLSAPYRYTSEDVIFAASTEGRAVADAPWGEYRAAQAAYFAVPRACLRASPLPRQYAWGIHCCEQGLVALVGGDDVIDRGKGPMGIAHLEAEVAEHAEGLRAGDLVDEVGADKELRLAVGERSYGVGVPDLVEEVFGLGHIGPFCGP
jgi:hypothetical protein